ncbi:MAG: LysR family transcriptional regulator [Lawsonibacter sp.]|nr:LysR family transcriptional regulator [Lawsonibacter sp.]
MFSLTSLKYFSVAAEELNFTRAAKRLFISQQALSTHISKLEEYYDVKLFDRGAPLTLTDAGLALQRYAKEILRSVDNYASELQDIKNFRQGHLNICIPVTRGTIMLPPLLSAFHQLFPQIDLCLTEKVASAGQLTELHNGVADLYIGYRPKKPEEFVILPLFQERFVILVPNHLLKTHFPTDPQTLIRKEPLSLKHFAGLPFVIQTPETTNGEVFQTLCRNEGITPNVVVSTQNLITEVTLCMEGLGACVVPLTFLSPNQRLSGLGAPPLFGDKGLGRVSVFLLDSSQINDFQICICYLRGKALTRAGQEFISLAKELYGNLTSSQIPPQLRFGSHQ